MTTRFALTLRFLLTFREIQAKRVGSVRVAVRALFEDCGNPRLALAQTFGQELRGHGGLSRPGRACHQDAVAFQDSAA